MPQAADVSDRPPAPAMPDFTQHPGQGVPPIPPGMMPAQPQYAPPGPAQPQYAPQPVPGPPVAAPVAPAEPVYAPANVQTGAEPPRTEVSFNQDLSRITLQDLLAQVVNLGGSDLHLPPHSPTRIRVNGRLRDLLVAGEPLRFGPQGAQEILTSVLTSQQMKRFEERHELDFAYEPPNLRGERFRCNFFFNKGAMSAVFRLIPRKIKSLAELQMPPVLSELARVPRGLFLVTGPTGSGKSTTLAAMVDQINQEKEDHILTIEDPIEFVHESKRSLVSQRELGSDTYSFANALKAALRQDPDVILVGEMRDPETIGLAITAAETGHVVFGTLHTQDASQTIDRIIDSFGPEQQHQIRAQLSMALQGVITQTLLPTKDGKGRVAACEILVVNHAVRNLLREGKVQQLYSVMQTSAKDGMQTLDAALAEHIVSGKLERKVAESISSNPEELDRLLRLKAAAGAVIGQSSSNPGMIRPTQAPGGPPVIGR